MTLVDHPIIRERLTHIRSVDSATAEFRYALHDVARLMTFEVTKDLETTIIEVETPLKKTDGYDLERPIVLVPILRAGVGMLNGFAEILTEASVGYIGLYRNEETHQPHSYYCKLPANIAEAEVILIDPMLATGGSAADAADELKKAGAERLRFACLIAAPEGVAAFEERHPDIPVFAAALDERLDENAYIIPGLGDAGDRYFGT
ncbi:MAG: uracil phosphoribosyltransferase [Verrucomicrobiales bacterium]|nr:uracil phosphoribosyltransferase [Verrucomicrobiales bacterium]|tara:strand:- start:3882 stop:4496 length:615 start_codon:yes stop_codon:yes gene_type:complete